MLLGLVWQPVTDGVAPACGSMHGCCGGAVVGRHGSCSPSVGGRGPCSRPVEGTRGIVQDSKNGMPARRLAETATVGHKLLLCGCRALPACAAGLTGAPPQSVGARAMVAVSVAMGLVAFRDRCTAIHCYSTGPKVFSSAYKHQQEHYVDSAPISSLLITPLQEAYISYDLSVLGRGSVML